ncbi:MAG: hypothetical protein M3Z02_05585 [Actinomycetota bacterium]|nr:hypothetical protein [Actinomycetota bacterium]
MWRPGGRPRTAYVLAGLLVVGLVLAGIAVAARGGGRHSEQARAAPPTADPVPASESPASSAATATASAPPTVDNEIASVLPELERFVERTRGLTYRQPVVPTLLDDAAFRKRLTSSTAQQTDRRRNARPDDAETTLRALDLLPRGTSLQAETAAFTGDAVGGFYDPRSKELVVRGTKATPFLKEILAHELTHALQDQYFPLDRPDLDASDTEVGLAFSALAEGDAVRVQEAYLRSLSPAERTAAAKEQSQGYGKAGADTPPALQGLFGFPYSAGPVFVRALLADGGQARLDAAFGNPPTTSEQVSEPAKYLAAEGPQRVDPPPAGGTVVDRGVLGEEGLFLLLASELGKQAAEQDSRGWGGDRYVSWHDGVRDCSRIALYMDDARATSSALAGLREWARAKPAATVTGTGPITITSCREP